jgi:phytoene synthase
VNTAVSDRITKKSASNLALAFVLLPPHKRAAMSALYAFCREVDDLADEESVPVERRREALAHWRDETRLACSGGSPTLPVLREFQPFIQEYRLPFARFDDLFTGVEMDLSASTYPDSAALERYCYHVASVVGLLSIEIFGYRDPACREYADALGKALQLTNILRDVGNDAARGRIYLPAADLARHGVSAADIFQRRNSEAFRRLAAEVAEQARGFYRRARTLLPAADRQAMVAAELMGAVYWQLLRRIEKNNFDVLADEPLRLSKWRKLSLILLAWCRVKTGLPVATYG